jgi:hypothetical protein
MFYLTPKKIDFRAQFISGALTVMLAWNLSLPFRFDFTLSIEMAPRKSNKQ